MNPSKFSETILRKIKARHIRPRSKWQFIARNIVFWGIFGISVLLGAGGVSVLIFALLETDFNIFSELSGSGWSLFFSWLPIFWIVFFVVFIGIALWGIRKTKKGYRFSVHKLLLINVIASILLGGMVYGIGGAEEFECIFADKAPMYQRMEHRIRGMWAEPTEGRLAGTILEVQTSGVLLLDDFSHQQWVVDITEIPTELPLEEGRKIKILGEKTAEHAFKAKIIRPLLERRGQLFGRGEEMRRPRSPEEREQFLKDHPEIREMRDKFMQEHPELMERRNRIE